MGREIPYLVDIVLEIEERSDLLFQAGAGAVEFVYQPHHNLHVTLENNIQLVKFLLQLLNGAEELPHRGLPCLKKAAKT